MPPQRARRKREAGSLASGLTIAHGARPMSEPLDNAVWQALTGPLARFATGTPPALRFREDVAPFSALPDAAGDDAWGALRTLAGPGGMAVLFRRGLGAPSGWETLATMPCAQMTYERPEPPAPTAADSPIALGESDGADMLALVAATRPGPFGPRTHQLGRYVGVRDDGRLVAMAGERLRVTGATEISAVRTDPAFQRRGLAAALVTGLVVEILARRAALPARR